MKRLLAATLCCGVLLAGCATPTPTTPPPTTPPPTLSPTATPEAKCRLEDILPAVDATLDGVESEAHILTINRQLTLSIWMVDPQLDPAAGAQAVDSMARRAFLTGARVSQRVVEQIPCVRTLLEAINPMIVDTAYNNWYIDIIPMRAFPRNHPEDDDLLTAIEQSGMEIAFLRRTPPQPHPLPAWQTCGWSTARDEIHALFAARARRNVATYPIIGYQPASRSPGDENGMYVGVQWDVDSPGEAESQAVLETLERVRPSLTCLFPPVDRLEVYVVDQHGTLIVYGLVPGDLLRGDQPLDANQFTLIFFPGR